MKEGERKKRRMKLGEVRMKRIDAMFWIIDLEDEDDECGRNEEEEDR